MTSLVGMRGHAAAALHDQRLQLFASRINTDKERTMPMRLQVSYKLVENLQKTSAVQLQYKKNSCIAVVLHLCGTLNSR